MILITRLTRIRNLDHNTIPSSSNAIVTPCISYMEEKTAIGGTVGPVHPVVSEGGDED